MEPRPTSVPPPATRPLGRVLVTGASGFVGSHLVPLLRARGASVIAVGTEAPAPALRDHLADTRIADLRELDSVRAAVTAARPDTIVHLAALSSASRSFQDPLGTFAVNATGTANLIEAVQAAAPRARVLVVSTGEIYGPQPEGSRVREDAPFHPVSPYAESKARADDIARDAVTSGPLDVVVARSFSHTGPGQTPTFVVPSWAEQIARVERGEAEPVLRVGNLEVTRDLSDVRDVVEAYLALLDRGHRGSAYNVCRGEGVRLSEVAARMCAMSSVPIRIEVDPERFRPADVPWLVGDPAAIARDCGWQARIPLDHTLRDVLDSWRTRTPA